MCAARLRKPTRQRLSCADKSAIRRDGRAATSSLVPLARVLCHLRPGCLLVAGAMASKIESTSDGANVRNQPLAGKFRFSVGLEFQLSALVADNCAGIFTPWVFAIVSNSSHSFAGI